VSVCDALSNCACYITSGITKQVSCVQMATVVGDCCVSADVWVKALFNRTATCEEELSFVEGQIICVQSKQPNGVDDGWWIGQSNGSTGLFPSMMVEELTPESLFVSDRYTHFDLRILQSHFTLN